jgi:hypothetical protein
MGVDWQRMDCPHCGEGLQCILCGADVRQFDDAALERAGRLLAEMWPDDFDPAGRGTFNVRAQQIAKAVLRAAGGQDAS